MNKFSSLLCSILVLTGLQVSQAQNIANAPYSKLGIGELNNNTGNVRNFGMGNLGVSTPNSYFVNVQNPALLFYNSRVTFEIAVAGQAKKIESADASQNTSYTGFGYLALALPITKNWRTAIGLRPYSSVNYNTYSVGPVPGAPENINYISGNNGEGTVSEAFFANGLKIYKGLTVGVTGSYLFGGIDRNAYTQLQDTAGTSNPQRVILNERTNYSDVMFRGGLSYRQALGKKANVTAGLVYGLQTDLNATRRITQQRIQLADATTLSEVPLDSLKSQETIPGYIEAGLSFDNNRNWVIGAEFATRDWTTYRNLDGNANTNLANSYRVALGGELTPDASSVESYLKRVTYRAGFNYANTPIIIGGEQLTDMSVHFGATLPIGSVPRPPEYNQSFVNLGVALGRNGTTSGGLLRENYIRFMVGISLNSVWFIKPKFD
ncbi:MAG: hypothetical protein COW65_10570 [Cytophagales bacterium CG18_big_fil_WC_8_21_14_2_50_42_9]|nr:MAG: hypothetical protein COW65_10570 [Cytophagales bacterium CG18_big_fil_WC_8_21_14_2_50_42_9]